MPIVNCSVCSNPTSMAARECPSCGHSIIPAPAPAVPGSGPLDAPPHRRAAEVAQPSGAATAGMICGVGGLVLLFVPCAWLAAVVPAVLGIVLSGASLSRISRGEATGWGMAVAGLLCGIIGTSLYGVLWLLFQDAVRDAFSMT